MWIFLLTTALAHDILGEDHWASLGTHGPVDLGLGLPGDDPFRQLDELWPTPSDARTASGDAGPAYWQNRADHLIEVTLDPETHTLTGSERITYTNASPHVLPYLWVQLDQNRFRPDSLARQSDAGPDLSAPVDAAWLARQQALEGGFGEGMVIDRVVGLGGRELVTTVVDTMMRVDLPRPLQPGASTQLSIDWHHVVVPEPVWARSRVEILDDGLPIYEIAQWFPRMAAYTDVDGWQHKAFVGRGEFTLEFGDYDVRITVPDTWVVASTGELANPGAVLSPAQRERLRQARTAERPVPIITAEEAAANEARTPTTTRTWRFVAEDVRDFAWAASPSFLQDAWGVPIPGTRRTALAMSYWPEEGDPLWSRYSTHAVAHALEVYSAHTVPYPYPVAISVNGKVGGMEYPMICFNGPRPEEDGTYTERTKYGLISVVIHEVGHNWFPMIINSDERQWTWMDEGLNTYVQFLAESAWEPDYPSRRGEPADIVPYMKSARLTPIMTNSESLAQFGNNAYGKPATALNILRETVLGRARMDEALRTYSSRWAFKRPQPADFFRTLEDASGTDLDWFYRGWFYTTGHVDLGIERITRVRLAGAPSEREAFARAEDEREPPSLSEQRNAELPRRTERFPELVDFYTDFDELAATPADERAWQKLLRGLEPEERAAVEPDWLFHVVRLTREHSLVMPVPLRITYADGSTELRTLPAELWKQGDTVVDKVLVSAQPITRIELDPFRELADVDRSDNSWPPVIEDAIVAVAKPDKDRPNRLRDARRESERAEALTAVTAMAETLVPAWEAAGALDEELLALPALAEATDPWGRRFTLTLSASLEDDAPLALVRSAGEDGQPDTRDDLTWAILTDGSVQAR